MKKSKLRTVLAVLILLSANTWGILKICGLVAFLLTEEAEAVILFLKIVGACCFSMASLWAFAYMLKHYFDPKDSK